MRNAALAITLMLPATMVVAADQTGPTTYAVDPAHSNVEFRVRHLVSRVSGSFGTFDGAIAIDWQDPAKSSVRFTIDAASIDTGNDTRDQHLRSEDFFFTEKYPTITFVSDSITATGGGTYDVGGTLTMRGVAKAVTLPVTYLGEVVDPWGNTKAGFELATTLDRTEFGLVWNKALETGGVLVGDDVEISIALETARE